MLSITLKYTHIQYVYAIYVLHILRRPLDYHGKQRRKIEIRLPLPKLKLANHLGTNLPKNLF